MVLVHRTHDRWQRAAPPSGSVAHDRASSVDRLDQSAAGVGLGAALKELRS
jgi:hypothetical protein